MLWRLVKLYKKRIFFYLKEIAIKFQSSRSLTITKASMTKVSIIVDICLMWNKMKGL